MLSFFSKPAATTVTRLPANGIEFVSWPSNLREIAQLLPRSLPLSLLQGLGIPKESIEDCTNITTLLQTLRPFAGADDENENNEHLNSIREAVRLALETCNQCHQLCRPEHFKASNSFVFRSFLNEMMGLFVPNCSLQEEVNVAVPRGQSAKLNFLPGLSATSQRAPFLALYDVQSFEEVFTVQTPEYSSKSDAEQNSSGYEDVLNRAGHSDFKRGSDVQARGSDATSSNTPSERLERYRGDLNKFDTTERSSPSPSSDSSIPVRGESYAYPPKLYSLRASGSGSASVDRLSAAVGHHDDNVQQTQQFSQGLPSVSSKDAYLLSEAQVGSAPSVALLCAGSMDELETLMLSSLYHRLVWGIMEPLIGFTWNSTEMIISTVFGWIDTDSADDGRLPDVHIVYADDGPANGVFDMTNPESILRLVIFLWNIRDGLDRIIGKLESAVPRVIQSIKAHSLTQWRADTTSKLLNDDCLSKKELFSLWQSRAQQLQNDVSFMSQAGTLSERNEEDYGYKVNNESPSERGPQARHWARSRSYFEEHYQSLSTPVEELWLQDRRAYSIPMSADEGSPRSDMMKLFNQYTQLYCLPNGVKSSMEFSLQQKNRELFEEIDRYSQDLCHNDRLDDTTWAHLMPHMGTVFKMSTSTWKKMRYKIKHRLMRSETLTEWGNLLTALFYSTDRNYRLQTITNREVDLPRNVASELVPFIYGDSEICFIKFRGYASFILTHILEWTDYRDALTNANAPRERINQVRDRLFNLGQRLLLFLTEDNKRYLLRSLQRDPVRSRTSCLGAMAVEATPPCFNHDTLSPDNGHHDGSSPHHGGFDAPGGSMRACQSNVPLELGILYYGYPGKTGHHPRQIPQTAMNHVRMNLVAGITHLASLGIFEFPLFGVAIDGSVGTIICAWCGPLNVSGNIESCIYVFDKDTVQYDLATPTGAYNYATFVSLLATKHAPELAARIKNRWTGESEVSEKNWSASGWIRDDWTMAEQVAWFEEHGYLDYFDCYSV